MSLRVRRWHADIKETRSSILGRLKTRAPGYLLEPNLCHLVSFPALPATHGHTPATRWSYYRYPLVILPLPVGHTPLPVGHTPATRWSYYRYPLVIPPLPVVIPPLPVGHTHTTRGHTPATRGHTHTTRGHTPGSNMTETTCCCNLIGQKV